MGERYVLVTITNIEEFKKHELFKECIPVKHEGIPENSYMIPEDLLEIYIDVEYGYLYGQHVIVNEQEAVVVGRGKQCLTCEVLVCYVDGNTDRGWTQLDEYDVIMIDAEKVPSDRFWYVDILELLENNKTVQS